jgi:hypothetical protein
MNAASFIWSMKIQIIYIGSLPPIIYLPGDVNLSGRSWLADELLVLFRRFFINFNIRISFFYISRQ